MSHQINLFKKTFYGLTSSNPLEARIRQGFHSFTHIYVRWSGSGFSRSYGRNRGALLQRFWMPKTDIFEGKLYAFFYFSQNWVFLNLCLIIVKKIVWKHKFSEFRSINFLYRLYLQLYTKFLLLFRPNQRYFNCK